MALSSGSRLGPYEVLALIGAGGMGEVYKARDTRLNRSVAIKVLPHAISHDPNSRTRFEQEARTIAGLNHPRICTLYDVGWHDGAMYLVMEHLPGETLADRLRKGPLPLTAALDVGVDIADALAAAHRVGIVHRDLKPANVMLTQTGVKLLDFGLAKLDPRAEPSAGEPVFSTQSVPLTAAGTVLGTVPYMAPEQVEGSDVDARTDVWALGAILYEMVAGVRAFQGASSASLMAAILERDPVPLVTHQRLTPRGLDHLVRRCLAKHPDDRWDTAHDVAGELRWIRESELGSAAEATTPRTWWSRLALPVATATSGALAATLWITQIGHREQMHPAPVIRTSVSVQPAEALGPEEPQWTPGGGRTAFTWTPDGGSLVYVGSRHDARQLYVRSLARDDARPLAGTDGAISPAVSTDGRWVVFWANGEIAKVPIAGGPREIVAAATTRAPTRIICTMNGDIVFDALSGIQKLSGGELLTLTRPTAGKSHLLPWLLPGDRVVLYTVRQRQWTWGDEEVAALDVSSGISKVLLHDAADARYAPSGHLLFLRRGVLFAVPFDPVRTELRGTPVAVMDGVAQSLSGSNSGTVTGAGQFAMAATGALAWVPSVPVTIPQASLVRLNRRGQLIPLNAPTRAYGPVLRISPDGHFLAVTVRSLTKQSLCVYDITRGTLTTLTNEGEVDWPTWTPDGGRIVFQSRTAGHSMVASVKADGSGVAEMLADAELTPSSWSPVGRLLSLVGDGQIRLLALDKTGKAALQSPLDTARPANSPELSPNSHWLAYSSFDSGSPEVYVQSYPGPGSRVQVSTQGGYNPAWNPNGNELFFMTAATVPPGPKMRMMVVQVREKPTLTLGVPQELFEFTDMKELWSCGPTRCYEVAPDGQSFFAVQYPATAPVARATTHINLVLNWVTELQEKVPR